MNKQYDVAAYVWPAYTGDEPRTRMFWQEGIGEWQSVKNATAKFEGHSWPRKPLWGYVNEADPRVMEMQIEEAVSHGVNIFIYDWYWYDDRPFLENCLNDGFLKAKNNQKMKFYIMWANHDANHIWNKLISDEFGDTVIWKGAVDRIQFEIICKRLIEKYFMHPSYYQINGCPVFMIYDLQNLINGLGGADATADALEWFRCEVKKAGFADLHLQLTMWNEQSLNLSGVDGGKKTIFRDVINRLGFDSMSHYQYCHFADIDRDYNAIMVDVKKEWEKLEKGYDVPYFPHISLGWDNNPRFVKFRKGIVQNNTPQNIEKALLEAKKYIDTHELPAPLITINSWNEWTETSYLQPDDLYGYGYLEAVQKVFKPQ